MRTIGFGVITLLALSLSPTLFSSPQYGGTLNYVIMGSVPHGFTGVQGMIDIYPSTWVWNPWQVYLDGGISHFSGHRPNSSITIYSFAPILRYILFHRNDFTPFIEGSLGLAYLNHTRFQKRNLGIHFAFQDHLGIGGKFGNAQRLTFKLQIIHYSNAHLSSHNSGITAPIMLNVGYLFH